MTNDNHCDPFEKQCPLPIKPRDLTLKAFFGDNIIIKRISIPTADNQSIVLELHTDSHHLAKFFETNWPDSTSDRKSDAKIIAMKESATAYGLPTEFDGARWFCQKTNQVWMFGNEFYGNIKITVRGLCSEVASINQMFVHGCAMAIDGRGLVLSGVSGAGKTTLTKELRKALGSRVQVVNDDWGPFSLASGLLKFTGEPYLHMKYPSVRALAPDIEISPQSHLSENFQGDTDDARARLLIKPTQVFGDRGARNNVPLNLFVVIVRDEEMPAGVRSFTLEDMPLLEKGKYSSFYNKTEWFLNGSLFITDETRRKRELDRHKMLIENFRCLLVNNVIAPEVTAKLVLAELDKVAPLEIKHTPTVCIIKSRKYPVTKKDISDGGTLNVYVIAQELLLQGYNVDVFTRNEEDGQELIELPGIRIFKVPFDRSKNQNVLIRDYEEGQSFVNNLVAHHEFKPSSYACIHTNHWTSGVGLGSYISKDVRLIHTPHLLASEKAHHNELFLPEFVRDAEKKLLDRANDIIALSISEKTAMCAEYSIDPNKITIAPNGIDDAFFKIPSLKTGTLCSSAVLFVGRTCRQKGIDVLLDATERLLNSGTIIFLRMIGGKYAEPSVDKSVKERIKKAPLASVVENLGEVTHDVVVSQMRKSFIYVQPSRYESQGIALLEAMASGRIVVASDLPAIREYIRHGENGLLVEPKNAQALADTLSTVFADPDKMISLGHEARKTARAYTWHNMLKIVLSLYNLQRK